VVFKKLRTRKLNQPNFDQGERVLNLKQMHSKPVKGGQVKSKNSRKGLQDDLLRYENANRYE